MRVVIDTNVLVGACLTAGTAAGVVRACLQGRCEPLIGTALLSEYEDVFGRDDLFRGSPLDIRKRTGLLDAFVISCQWVRVYYTWRPNLRDEADNHLIELAVAGAADAIVTRNLRDLMASELHFPQLKILSPENFLKEI
jgi:putative PIN family toxin of toxin-antitoxin system